MVLVSLVLLRITANPLSNLFQKKLVADAAHPLFVIFTTFGLLSLASIPAIKIVASANIPPEYFYYMILCAIFAVSSNALLVEALKYGDLSLLGPVNSYKPVVGLIFGIFLIGEIPNITGLLGVALILFGSYFLSDNIGGDITSKNVLMLFKDKGVRLRMSALVLSATEAVFLKKALQYSTPFVSVILWCFLGFVISAAVAVVFTGNRFKKEIGILQKNKTLYFLLFISTGIMQYCTLLVFEELQVGYALALFQVSALISVILGYKYFNEKNIRKRFAGSIIMIIGAAAIILNG